MSPSLSPQRKTRWCFTLNNYDDESYTKVKEFCETDRVKYAVVGKETGETGTPHLQGFVILTAAQRLSFLRSHLSDRAHYEAALGSNEQAADYCKKDGDYWEKGTLPTTRGQGSKWERFRDWIKGLDERPSDGDLFTMFPSLIGQYPNGVYRALDIVFPPPVVDLSGVTLRPWQSELEYFLSTEPNDRTVEFYVDPQGGSGKSYFANYYLWKHPDSQFLSVGKRDDLAHTVDPTKRVFLLDIPRGGMEFLQYGFLEQLKNRRVFSPKYNSYTKVLHACPHVVVFTNESPNMMSLTLDRYSIHRLSEEQPLNILN